VDVDRIREQLRSRGYNFTQIANVLKVTPNHVSAVARRVRQNHKVAIAIATALEKPVERVFPDVPMYHGPVMTQQQREEALSRQLEEQGVIRRSA
jgi:transcriptional regulator with XRE-family HTH domain